MIVGLLTIEQKESIEGQYFTEEQPFHAYQYNNEYWYISRIQMYTCTNPDFMWVKDLPLIEYVPLPPNEDIPLP